MDLEQHYTNLRESALSGFREGRFELDPYLTSAQDDRYGITLLLRPDAAVKENIGALLQELKQVEPEQYYYPASDIHTTLLSIISCHAGFRLNSIAVGEYLAVLQECLAGIKSFQVDYRGITASPSCLMVQGFPDSAQLQNLRDSMRDTLRKTSLRHTLDSRYVLTTAHCTVVRFKAPLQNPSAFLEKVQGYTTKAFGSTRVSQVELVYNDWYQRQAVVQQLGVFELK